jgi:uncharacterized protein (DUF885 family)
MNRTYLDTALRLIVCGACFATAHSRAEAATSGNKDATRVTAIGDAYYREWIATFPEFAELYGLKVERHDGFSDNSLTALRAWEQKEDEWDAALSAIDGKALWGSPEWTTYGIMKEGIAASRGARVCHFELWPVNQLSGWQATLSQLAQAQPLGTPALREQALARFELVPRFLDNEIANLREGLRQGYSTPKHNVELVIAQLDQVVSAAPADSPFYSPAQRDPDPKFQSAWESLLKDSIVPAVTRYRDFLRNEYLPAARETIAVTANPNGLACYAAALRSSTTLQRTPQETYELGQKTVARYEAEASALGQKLYGTPDLGAIRERLEKDPANHFKTREELLAFATDAVARAKAACAQTFSHLPKADAVLEPVPAFLEAAGSTSSYEAAAEDGSRPGTYRILLYQPEHQTRANVEITAFHEVYPGHHVQISLAQELPAAHPVTHIVANSAFIEGWGRYSEALAEEMGLYTSDAGRIQRRMWPAHGMVLDPGIHVMGWTRQQARDYAMATGRFTERESDALVDRIAVWPGQLTAYDSGALEIFALREQSKQALGDKFEIRRFHECVLGHGSVTLPMLREVVGHCMSGETEARTP